MLPRHAEKILWFLGNDELRRCNPNRKKKKYIWAFPSPLPVKMSLAPSPFTPFLLPAIRLVSPAQTAPVDWRTTGTQSRRRTGVFQGPAAFSFRRHTNSFLRGDFLLPHTALGHTQSSDRFSKGVPGAIPETGPRSRGHRHIRTRCTNTVLVTSSLFISG